MTTEKTPATLATAKHGGCVKLGDGLHVTVLREMRARLTDSGSPARTAALDAAIAALSAQPSPGGQDALAEAARRVISDVDSSDYHGEISEATYAALEAALAARQPVGMTEGAMRAAASRQTASGESNATAEALMTWARQPVGEPVLWVSPEVLDAMAIHRAQDFPADGMGLACPAGSATVPLYLAPPAQAVDLEQFRPAVCAMGLYAEEPEEVDEAKRLLALIDSQAVQS